MKNLILAFVGFHAFLLAAQEKRGQVSLAAKNTFKNEFPQTKAKWSVENGTYEAGFKWKGAETSATYNESGQRIELETEIEPNQLPAATLLYLKNKFPSQKIREASKIRDDKNRLTYEAEMKEDGKPVDLLFDANGNFLH